MPNIFIQSKQLMSSIFTYVISGPCSPQSSRLRKLWMPQRVNANGTLCSSMKVLILLFAKTQAQEVLYLYLIIWR